MCDASLNCVLCDFGFARQVAGGAANSATAMIAGISAPAVSVQDDWLSRLHGAKLIFLHLLI